MNMFKTPSAVAICALLLLLTQCKSSTTAADRVQEIEKQTVQKMEMRTPAFAKAKTTFYKWTAGLQGGGTGIHMEFDWNALPENLVMKVAYFRGLKAPIQQGQQGYSANFAENTHTPEDMIMHGDAVQEAANRPPKKRKKFPVKLTEQQVGILYEENGQLVYTIINNTLEQPEVALPSAAPQDKGY